MNRNLQASCRNRAEEQLRQAQKMDSIGNLAVKPGIPVVLCTGYSKKISDETALQMGIKAFAYKPIIKNELARTIRQVLDESSAGS